MMHCPKRVSPWWANTRMLNTQTHLCPLFSWLALCKMSAWLCGSSLEALYSSADGCYVLHFCTDTTICGVRGTRCQRMHALFFELSGPLTQVVQLVIIVGPSRIERSCSLNKLQVIWRCTYTTTLMRQCLGVVCARTLPNASHLELTKHAVKSCVLGLT